MGPPHEDGILERCVCLGEVGPLRFFDESAQARQYAHGARDDLEQHSL
jgi:hypothetical protein